MQPIALIEVLAMTMGNILERSQTSRNSKDYFIEAQMLYHPTPSWLWIISPNALGSVTLEHNDMWKEMTEVKFLIREAAHFILPTNKVGLSRLGSKSPR
jgi:hypothetical protein